MVQFRSLNLRLTDPLPSALRSLLGDMPAQAQDPGLYLLPDKMHSASPATAWPHGWAHQLQPQDILLCVSHVGEGGPLVQAVATVLSYESAPHSPAMEAMVEESNGNRRRPLVISLVSAADSLGCERASALQQLSDLTLSYPIPVKSEDAAASAAAAAAAGAAPCHCV
eukprot:COSAG05_NODE_1617_length_4393_cov_5.095249_2_plen_168_part_00